MRVLLYILLFFISSTFFSQGSLGFDTVNPCTGFYDFKNKRPIPYTYIRLADIAWRKRVWRDIDLREKLNLPLYYPIEFDPCRTSLSQLLITSILNGRIQAFANDNFTIAYTRNEIRKRLIKQDSIIQYIIDANGETIEKMVPLSDSLDIFSRLLKIRIKEDWVFDKQRSFIDVRIVALAVFEWIEEKEAWRELFWVYFPACRTVFASTPAFNYANDEEQRSFDEVFMKRMFSSVIIKESNVFDRNIDEYERGIDALTESDKIKLNIFTWEHDLWHY
jgi:gliding motility associated protien GldN